MLIDSHCHLDFPDLAARLPAVLEAATAAGVGRLVTISTWTRQAARYRALADAHPEIYFTVGTHPHNADEEADITERDILAETGHPRCVAVGEAGLDFHYDRAPRDVQEQVFRVHIAAARESALPLVIHARNADADMERILAEEMGRGRFDAVLHCFSAGERLARVGVELGLYVSFSGIVTFRASTELRRIAASIPHDRILVETDAPYLAPVPFRGRINEPAFVVHTAAVLAAALGLSEQDARRATTENTLRLFAKMAEPGLTAVEAA